MSWRILGGEGKPLVDGVEALTYLDTHIVAWLYGGQSDRLSPHAVERIESEDLLISPVVILERESL